MMRLIESPERLTFAAEDGRIAGHYAFDDAFKPSLHPLATPSGLVVSAFMPHDHKHHRALMYALRVPDVNFWEERVTLPQEAVGRQRHEGFTAIEPVGESVGFTQRLHWSAEDGSLPTFAETRRIACRLSPGGDAFIWDWSMELVALRDTALIMSQWSAPRADGALVNYHGLGLRLPREFGGSMANIALRIDGESATVADAMGKVPATVEYVAAVDGYWPVRRAGVRITQGQPNALFILKDPFAYVSLGASNLAQRPLLKGERLVEHYRIEVFEAAQN